MSERVSELRKVEWSVWSGVGRSGMSERVSGLECSGVREWVEWSGAEWIE